ncbi:MAG TPA: ABC transporter substrate-binding protein [Opitutaceae bacterium]|nr:ABC transporter substrate-binding protein [Opitutaceae bacterium]
MTGDAAAFLARLLRLPLALAGIAAAASPGAEPIRIGFFMSMTGRDASFGEASLRGAMLAVDGLNSAGGVLHRPVELVVEDDRSLAGESATAVKKLISRDHVVALVGECSSARTLEAAPIAQASGIPLVTPASTSPKVTQAGNAIFRVCFVDSFQGDVIATFARRRLGLSRAALLVDSTAPYSVGLAEYFSRRFSELGGEVVASQNYSGTDTDFRAQLTAIRAAGPDALFLPGYYVAAGLVARQARELGLKATLLGGDGFEAPQLLEIGGSALEGAYYSTHFAAENTDPASRAFVEAFRARYGAAPNGLSALTYDAVRLVADAIWRAGTTERGALRFALSGTRAFPGVTGLTTINAERNADKEAAIITVRNGRPTFVETILP